MMSPSALLTSEVRTAILTKVMLLQADIAPAGLLECFLPSGKVNDGGA